MRKKKLKTESKSILLEAEHAVNGPRHDDYGSWEENWGATITYWNVHLRHKLKDGEQLSASDGTMMMILAKIAREEVRHKRDNLVDVGGYAEGTNRLREKGL